jgi:outer membrane protein assembly factor BamB
MLMICRTQSPIPVLASHREITLIPLLFSVVLVWLSTNTASAQDWPRFKRDLQQLGQTEGTSPTSSAVAWECTCEGNIPTSPAIVNGRIYFVNVAYTTGAVDTAYCLDLASGERIWVHALHDAGDLTTRSSPAVVDGRVYFGSQDGLVYCLDAEGNGDGTTSRVWSYQACTDCEVLSCPAVVQGKVYFGIRKGAPGEFLCLDAEGNDNGTTDLIWSYEASGQIFGSPAVDPEEEHVFFTVAQTTDNVVCLRLEDQSGNGTIEAGEEEWTVSLTDMDAQHCSPALFNGLLYCAGGNTVYCLDQDDGHTVWKRGFTNDYFNYSSPIIYKNRMYIGSSRSGNKGGLIALHAYTGDPCWDKELYNEPLVAPAAADKRIFICGRDNYLYCFNYYDGDEYFEDCTYHFRYGSPSISGGKVFLGESQGTTGSSRLIAFGESATASSASQACLASDGFPEIGKLDLTNLENNHVRFDMAQNIAPHGQLRNDPGDSLVFDVVVGRPGASLIGPPRLVYVLHPNPLFDSVRTSGLPNRGTVDAYPCREPGGAAIPGRWCVDLPDTGFFFPGDVIHYCIETEDSDGSTTEIRHLPADTSGFPLFQGMSGYNPLLYPVEWTVRALPSLASAQPVEQPEILLWLDGGDPSLWIGALRYLNYVAGVDYDLFRTGSPEDGVGDGLGGRATAPLLDQYAMIMYSSGDQPTMTITPEDFDGDPGGDVELLLAWLDGGTRYMLLTGDGIVSDMLERGSGDSHTFVTSVLGISELVNYTMLGYTPSEVSFAVESLMPDLFHTLSELQVYGAGAPQQCVDAVRGTAPIAWYPEASPSDLAAATLNEYLGDDNVIYFPYDLARICTAAPTAKNRGLYSARALLLHDIFTYFGFPGSGSGEPIAVPSMEPFSLRCLPNPFNPRLVVEYSLPRRGDLDVRVFDLRGGLVRVLHSGTAEAGPGRLFWDGRGPDGRTCPSGVYLYRAVAGEEIRRGKVMLVR